MRHLSIDIETYSPEDIRSAGLYRYAEHPEFEILLFAYAFDFGEVEVVDLCSGEKIPDEVICALTNPNAIKHAYNAAFEWYCLSKAGLSSPITQWRDTMAHARYLGYPGSLEAVGHAVGLPNDAKKSSTGKALIRYFCQPCKPTRANGGRRRNLPSHDPDRWALFVDYNRQDVVAEMAVLRRLMVVPFPESEQRIWEMDLRINARGVPIDSALAHGALEINDRLEAELMEEARHITGLDNPNSPKQLMGYLDAAGRPVDNLQKATVAGLLAGDLPDDIRRVLEIRQELSKTSVKKYEAMQAAACADHRTRGLMQYYGAARTGRWAGRLVQVQNLPRNYIATLDEARRLARSGNLDALRLIYGDASDILSQLIRTAFVPSKDKLIVADFSAIEARVIAWLAGEAWVQEVFATHGKIYEATASAMFGVPIEKIAKGSPEYALRQKGKIAQLALGYQGSVGAMVAMGALKMGLSEDELPEIVDRWRSANPNIVALWYAFGEAAIAVMTTGAPQTVRGITFSRLCDLLYGQDFMTVTLPSGRQLFYPSPVLKENKFGRPALHYKAVATGGRWAEDSTYGGKLTENIVQAIARDALAVSMRRVEAAFPEADILMHIHDEIVLDAPQALEVDAVCEVMGRPIEWAPGLILRAAGFESPYYCKD